MRAASLSFFIVLFVLASCDDDSNPRKSSETNEGSKNESFLDFLDEDRKDGDQELGADLNEKKFFWQDDAWLGNGLGQGGRIYHVVKYRPDMSEAETQDYIAKLKSFLRNGKAGSEEYARLGRIRYRDYAAIVSGDLTNNGFYIGMSESIEARERRILELVKLTSK